MGAGSHPAVNHTDSVTRHGAHEAVAIVCACLPMFYSELSTLGSGLAGLNPEKNIG